MCFFWRCNGTQVYSIVRNGKKEVNNIRSVKKKHHFRGSPFWCDFLIPKCTKFDPLAGGTELTSFLQEPPAHSWPFQPPTQHTHILVIGAAFVKDYWKVKTWKFETGLRQDKNCLVLSVSAVWTSYFITVMLLYCRQNVVHWQKKSIIHLSCENYWNFSHGEMSKEN